MAFVPSDPKKGGKKKVSHLSRLGELLNTQRNVHPGVSRGAPRGAPGDPVLGGVWGGIGGSVIGVVLGVGYRGYGNGVYSHRLV